MLKQYDVVDIETTLDLIFRSTSECKLRCLYRTTCTNNGGLMRFRYDSIWLLIRRLRKSPETPLYTLTQRHISLQTSIPQKVSFFKHGPETWTLNRTPVTWPCTKSRWLLTIWSCTRFSWDSVCREAPIYSDENKSWIFRELSHVIITPLSRGY